MTYFVIISVFLFVLVYTAFATEWKQLTVSRALRDAAWKFNSVSFIFGLLIGHWFFPTKNPDFTKVGYALPFLLGMIIYDAIWHFKGLGRTKLRWPAFPFVVGVVIGVLFWGQRSLQGPL